MDFTWLKAYTPRSLLGRAALILLLPVVTIQLVVGVVFIQRHYENVTRQMTEHLVLDFRHLAEVLDRDPAAAQEVARTLEIRLGPGAAAPAQTALPWFDLPARIIDETMAASFPAVTAIDAERDRRRVAFRVETATGPVLFDVARGRLVASNPHQLLVLMAFVSLVLTAVSFLFLKNQVRPIRRLAEAATAFGRGRSVAYRPSGATEVRAAGSAFLDMRNRIERHIEQRTLMLSGVSHDLRTPLTRIRLGLSMMEPDEEVRALGRDVAEMEGMIDAFLLFAREDATEETETVDAVDFAEDAVERARRGGGAVTLHHGEGAGTVTLRRMAVARALDNLIGNALRYGDRAEVSVAVSDRAVRFTVEDDGPGIPESARDAATAPFTRLDAARNQNRGGGVGLGLALARDVARQHGGQLRLGRSERLGGLQADLVIAR